MRKIKITYLLTMMFIVASALAIILPTVKAESLTKLSDYIDAVGEREETDLLGGVKLYKQRIKSYYDGITDPTVKGYEYAGNTVQWVDLPATSEEVKMVVWSQGTKHSFKSSRTTLTAKDWEEQHPGWIVIAAVNGDFFQINSTFEANGLMIQDTDVIRAYQHGPASWIGESYGALTWDKDNNFKEGLPTVSNTMSLEIRGTDGNYTEVAKVDVTNPKTIPDTGIALVTKDIKFDVDLTGATVYLGEYELNRISNEGPAFVKGTIIDKLTNLTEKQRPKSGEFYLVSKDGSLDKLLSNDTYVRCQYNLTGEWAGVESAVSYFNILLKDNKHLFFQDTIIGIKHDYGIAKNPRTVIGLKEDGSIVMMVSDGRGMDRDYAVGLSYFQIAEMMRLVGCHTVYQMDGGGSATLVARNSQGNLEVINRPSDGSERSIGNAILMVMRDPGIKVDVKNTTRNSITITKSETLVSDLLEDIKVTIDGKTQKLEGNSVTIGGLKESTEYLVQIEYLIVDYRSGGKKIKGGYTVKAKTKDFIMPPSGLEITEINKNEIVITKRDSEFASWIQAVTVYVGDESYYMGEDFELRVSGLFDDTDYSVYFTYNVIEPGNEKIYKGKDDVVQIRTLAFNLPTFPKFEITNKTENSVKIAYEYDDEDDIALGVSVVAYDESGKEVARQSVSRKRGNVEFTNLDLTSGNYSFKLEVLYYEKEGAMFASTYYSNEIIAEKVVVETPVNPEPQPEPQPTPQPETPKKGCGKSAGSIAVATLSAVSLAVLVLRKKK